MACVIKIKRPQWELSGAQLKISSARVTLVGGITLASLLIQKKLGFIRVAKFIRTTRNYTTTINCIFILIKLNTIERDLQHLFS